MAKSKKQKKEKVIKGAAVKCNLSTILGARRMGQAALARETGISTTTVHVLYHDKWGGVDRNTLAQLCKVLECTPGELFTYEPSPND